LPAYLLKSFESEASKEELSIPEAEDSDLWFSEATEGNELSLNWEGGLIFNKFR